MSTAEQVAERERITAADKRFRTAQAHTALAGGTLNVVGGDDGRPVYIASRGCWTREFADLAEIEVWLDRVAPPRA